jgi:hypothetical protein
MYLLRSMFQSRIVRINRRCQLILAFYLAHSTLLFSGVGGVIAVVSPQVTQDNRPILWQNLDSDEPLVEVSYFAAARYNFIGLVNGGDSSRVYAGLNTAGFALALSFPTFADEDTLAEDAAQFAKKALGECGKVDDFIRFFADSGKKFVAGTSFACMDAYNGSLMIEANGTQFPAYDPFKSPDGFIVRANFNLSQPHYADEMYWRYHRARELFSRATRDAGLSYKYVITNVARDLAGIEPLPAIKPVSGAGRLEEPQRISCRSGINNHRTVSCVVIHGVRPQEKPELSTFWVTLGEPLCGVAVPLWPVAGTIPKECRGPKSVLNLLIRDNERFVYDSKSPDLLNTQALADKQRGLLPYLIRLENDLFQNTDRLLDRWRSQVEYSEDLTKYQKKAAADLGRKILY